MGKREKIQLFENHSIGTVLEFLKNSNQVSTLQELATKINGSYTSMSTRRNEIGGIGDELGNKLLKHFDLSGLPKEPPRNGIASKEEAIDLAKNLVKKVDDLEIEFTKFKLEVLQKLKQQQ